MRKCPKCGGRTSRRAREATHTIAGRVFTVRLASTQCTACGAIEDDPESVRHAELEIACWLATDGPVDGGALRYIRRALGMRASELADLLELTAETVSRWENNQRRIDRGAWIVVGSLVLEDFDKPTNTLNRLASAMAGSRQANVTVDARRFPTRRHKRISGTELRAGLRWRAP